MKTIEEIENLSMDAMERIASDSSLQRPDNLRVSVADTLTASAIIEQQANAPHQKRVIGISAASLAAAACMAGAIIWHSQPKDTFSDPMLAYAQLEHTFRYMQEKVGDGMEMTGEAGAAIEKTTQILKHMGK